MPVRGRPGGLNARRERDHERERVHEDVGGVGKQREAARNDAAGNLDRRHGHGQHQREAQTPARRMPVRVRMLVRVRRHRQPRAAFTASAASIAPKVAKVRVSARAITPAS